MKLSLQGGFLPNVFKVLSHRPAEFRAFFAYYNELMNKDTGLYWPLCNKNMLKPGEMWEILGVQILNVLCKTLPQHPPQSSTACLYTTILCDSILLLGFPRFQDFWCTSRQTYEGWPWADCGGHQHPQQVSLLCGIPQRIAPDLLQKAQSCWSGIVFLWLHLLFYFGYNWCWTADHVTSHMLQPGHH